MANPNSPTDELSVSHCLKRGTLFGAAIGMLAGLIYLAIQGVKPDNQIASIILWRNAILLGAGLGLITAAAIAWRIQRKTIPKTENRKLKTEN